MSERLVAVEINSLEAWQMVCALQPHYRELSVEENFGNFVVVSTDDPKLAGAILTPGTIAEHFDHIEPSPRKLKFVEIVK